MGIAGGIAAAAGIGAVGSVASGAMSSGAASSAAKTQQNAANVSAENEVNLENYINAAMQPFVGTGQAAEGLLSGMVLGGTNGQSSPQGGALIQPFQPTMTQLSQTPGYQFTLQQGLEAAQNGFAAQGLGSSGAALKGGTQYAEGLAGTTYQQQFQNYLSQNQQIYNMLGGIAGSGQNAVGVEAGQDLGATSQVNSLLTGGAAANAAGQVGSTNALTGGISGATNAIQQGALLSGLFQQQAGTASALDAAGNATSAGGQALQGLGLYSPIDAF